MRFSPLEIPDVILIEPRVFEDERGYFFEAYKRPLFQEHGINVDFIQDNESRSRRGVLRGLHYQASPRAQAKLVRVTEGSAFDVAVDIRPGSKTFGRFISCVLSAENKKMLYIPAGFAHGFCALEEDTELSYKISDLYSPDHERGILWNDPALAIPWPKMDYILSEKDGKFPAFKDVFGGI